MGRGITTKMAALSAVALTLGIAGFVLSPSASAAGKTCTWTGAAAEKKFSLAENWRDCGGAAPQAGDIIKFTKDGLADGHGANGLTNDLDVALGGLIKDETGLPNNSSKDVWISSLRLADGAVISGVRANENGNITLNLGVIWQRMTDLVAEGNLSLGETIEYRNIKVQGVLTVTGSYRYKDGDSFARLVLAPAQAQNNDSIGFVYPEKAAIAVAAPIEVTKEGVTLNFGSHCVDTGGFGCTKTAPTTWTIQQLTLQKPVTINTWSEDTTVVLPAALKGSPLIKLDDLSRGKVQYSGDAPTETPKVVELKDKKAERYFVPSIQTATLTGERREVEVNGTLKGTGATTDNLWVNGSGTLSPGLSPGCLTAGSLNLFGTYIVEIGGKDACTGYDQLKVATYASIGSEATLELYGFGNFSVQAGSQYKIIDMTGANPVQGTFKDLPEGATVRSGTAEFRISYRGGDGNDVVLTALADAQTGTLPTTPATIEQKRAALKAPNTGIAQQLATQPLPAVVAGLIAAVAAVMALRKKYSHR